MSKEASLRHLIKVSGATLAAVAVGAGVGLSRALRKDLSLAEHEVLASQACHIGL